MLLDQVLHDDGPACGLVRPPRFETTPEVPREGPQGLLRSALSFGRGAQVSRRVNSFPPTPGRARRAMVPP
jgi:hypothetical protein